MSSQEEYLDNLLNQLQGETSEIPEVPGGTIPAESVSEELMSEETMPVDLVAEEVLEELPAEESIPDELVIDDIEAMLQAAIDDMEGDMSMSSESPEEQETDETAFAELLSDLYDEDMHVIHNAPETEDVQDVLIEEEAVEAVEPVVTDEVSGQDILAEMGDLFGSSESAEEFADAYVVPDAEAVEESVADTVSIVPGIDDISEMTEEDIDRMLSAGQSEWADGPTSEAELEALLGNSDDSDLQQIHELLQKAENNEEIEADEETAEAKPDPKELRRQKAEEKKQKKMEAKEARKAAKEAKKQERLVKKAAEKAAKEQAESEEQVPEEEDQIVEAVSDLGDMEDAFGDVFAQADEIPTLEDDEIVAVDISELEDEAEPVAVAAEEDDILSGLSEFDLFGDPSVAEDSLFADDLPEELVDTDSIVQEIEEREKPKKKGFFSRIVDMLTEEVEDDSDKEAVPISDENREILEEMDKKKKKKKEAMKSKKGKNAEEANEEGAEDEGKKKKEKKKKPKKEKAPKMKVVHEDDGAPMKKLPAKRVVMIMVMCLCIGGVIILLCNLLGDYSDKKAGRDAYYAGDYQTCYQNLYGKKLNESEQVMYSKSESILHIRMWMKEYELLVSEGSEAEALDSLLQSVYDYPTLYGYASEWNASADVAEYYAQILNILSTKYHLTEAQAQEIANEPNDVIYTKMVFAIINGEGFGSWNPEQPIEQPEEIKDELPEEGMLNDSEFVDNQAK